MGCVTLGQRQAGGRTPPRTCAMSGSFHVVEEQMQMVCNKKGGLGTGGPNQLHGKTPPIPCSTTKDESVSCWVAKTPEYWQEPIKSLSVRTSGRMMDARPSLSFQRSDQQPPLALQ
ncbi:unnamed protein product [Leuciscus chuanchicus]